MTQANLGDQELEPLALITGGCAFAKVFVDGLNLLSRPTQLNRALGQLVLQIGALSVVDDLAQRGLANIHVSEFRLMRRSDRCSG